MSLLGWGWFLGCRSAEFDGTDFPTCTGMGLLGQRPRKGVEGQSGAGVVCSCRLHRGVRTPQGLDEVHRGQEAGARGGQGGDLADHGPGDAIQHRNAVVRYHLPRGMPPTDSAGGPIIWLLGCLAISDAGIGDPGALCEVLSRVSVDDGNGRDVMRADVLRRIQMRLPVGVASGPLGAALGVWSSGPSTGVGGGPADTICCTSSGYPGSQPRGEPCTRAAGRALLGRPHHRRVHGFRSGRYSRASADPTGGRQPRPGRTRGPGRRPPHGKRRQQKGVGDHAQGCEGRGRQRVECDGRVRARRPSRSGRPSVTIASHRGSSPSNGSILAHRSFRPCG